MTKLPESRFLRPIGLRIACYSLQFSLFLAIHCPGTPAPLPQRLMSSSSRSAPRSYSVFPCSLLAPFTSSLALAPSLAVLNLLRYPHPFPPFVGSASR
eukprot:scaffold130958_cov22-Tisochrysis_lutea.AAC.1